jgi:methionyl-tRNA formyltransferase
MKIGFFGTPDIACTALEHLCGFHEILFVVTGEDKPAGRNRRITVCPVKSAASCRSIPVLQPQKLSDPDFYDILKSFEADIFVVVAYGKLIPAKIFNLPPLKTINLHPSLLPKYRGAAPVEWTLINGESETGVTVQLINEKLDAGDIVVQEKISLDSEITAGELYSKVYEISCGLINTSIEGLAGGTIVPRVQVEAEAAYCGKISRETAKIDWNRSAHEIHNLVRGLNPKPGAWTEIEGRVVKIWRTRPIIEGGDVVSGRLEPGMASVSGKKRLITGTGDGLLEILELQPETKKPMDALSFINGHRLSERQVYFT